MKLERNYVGQMCLGTGEVEITDPCYDRDTWCRTKINVKPGVYNCYAYSTVDPLFGQRVMINQIVIADDEDSEIAEEKVRSGRSWRQVDEIGVDAGLAGFFDNKPDFDDDAWDEFCSWMHDPKEEHNPEGICDAFIRSFEGRDGFWTYSGFGDGGYPVYAIRNNGKIVALEIRF